MYKLTVQNIVDLEAVENGCDVMCKIQSIRLRELNKKYPKLLWVGECMGQYDGISRMPILGAKTLAAGKRQIAKFHERKKEILLPKLKYRGIRKIEGLQEIERVEKKIYCGETLHMYTVQKDDKLYFIFETLFNLLGYTDCPFDAGDYWEKCSPFTFEELQKIRKVKKSYV